MDIKGKIDAAVESQRQEALELLQMMVRTPSLEGEEKAVQEIVARKLGDMQLEVDMWDPPDEELQAHPAYVPVGRSYKDRPNVVGIYRGTGSGRSLILNGHVDVVPIGPEDTWSIPPWSGIYQDGRVYGRGSADMKGGCVSNIMAIKALQAAGIRLILRGYTADACNFTEPSGLDRMAISNRGAQYFRITVPGQEGGTEYKHQLVNPITKAMEVFQAIEAYSIMREASVSHPLYDAYYDTKVPLGVCKIQAGEWPSTVASQCVMEGTIECLPGENIHIVKDQFKKYLLEWSAKDAWLKDHPLKIEWFGLWFDAAEISPDHPYIKTIREIVKETTDEDLLVGGGGGCDLRLPVLYGHTPAVLFGPKGGLIHGTDEYVEFEQVITCSKILALAATRWCGLAE
jgi:acetylornithine deacetylase